MPAISKAAIDTLINSTITVQTAPDSITPTTLDDPLYALNESCYNKVDGIAVTGMTNLIPGVGNGQNLEAILSLIMAQLNTQTNPDGMIPYLFRAEKTEDQEILSYSTGSAHNLSFEDDTTAPNYDTSNIFYRDKFVANIAMVKTFALEKVCLYQAAPDGDTWKIRILKNGVEIAASASKTDASIDEYGNHISSTDGYIFPSLVAPGVSLVAGDVVTAELFCVLDSSAGTVATLKAGHPAGKPTFSNA